MQPEKINKKIMNTPTTESRKSFLAKSVLGAGGLLAGMTWLSKVHGAEDFNAEVDKRFSFNSGEWIPSCCNMCGGQTGILCQVVDGKLIRIKPNSHNPIGFSNISDDFFNNCPAEGASMCPKGNAGIMTLYDPDRLAKPVKRTNPKKGLNEDPGWQEISWDEAYKTIVAKMKQLKDAGTPEALLWFSEDHSFTHIQKDFCDLYGSPNYSNHSNLCDTARKASFKAVMGDERPLMDSIQSKYILLFGWNPLGATKWSCLPRIITRALENGAKLVVVDPYLSYTARKANEWIPIRPSTDGAMALAMCHVIIRDKLYDEKFINEWTYGFEQFSEHVKDKTPEWAEKITTVPAATIERIAKEFANAKPAVVDVWSGPGQHSNAVNGGAAIAALAALTGGIDRKGTLVSPNKKGNSHQHLHVEKPKAPRYAGDNKKYPMFHGSGCYTEIFQQLADKKGNYPAKMAMIVFQNPVMAVPGTETVIKALSNLEFVVVNDIFLSETALMADIVVPGATYLERYDWTGNWVTWPSLSLRQPVVKPIFGQPTEAEFVVEIGRRLGLTDSEGHEFFWNNPITGEREENLTKWYEAFFSKEIINGAPKITLEEFKKLPGAVWTTGKTEYEKYKKEIAEDVLKTTVVEKVKIKMLKNGEEKEVEIEHIYDKPKADGGKRLGTYFMVEDENKNNDPKFKPKVTKKAVKGFMTPTGKVELVLNYLKGKTDANGNPCSEFPDYKQRDWYPNNEFPCFLINWKEATHTHTRTQNNRWLLELKPENPLQVNTKTGEKLGLSTGDIVWVESKYGKMKAKVQLTEAIHPEVVGSQHGFGHWAMGKEAKGRGSTDSNLRPCKSDPIGGQSLHKECCVKIYKV
ncbi:MAG: hypothetical protein A3H98_08360 [Bacteroidetes bacterium RIFCSPLOWO2_02_FULL_36_8]|nr:MAG: hypothetical protein A3H98_08360 [Bacteroidetes bacterium RIFCSPLOWO2_02_FULL_36_8]